MTSRISFYLRQASSNLRHSLLIILSISIAISMVAGVSYYMDSYERTSKINAFNNICDINVNIPNNQIDFSSNITNNYYQIMQGVNKSGLDIEDSFKYALLFTHSCSIIRNITDYYETQNSSVNDFNEMPLNVFITDNNFYQSKGFSQYFTLEKGTFPSNQSEILISDRMANQFDFYVGDKINLTTVWWGNKEYYYNIINITISGIYQLNFGSNDYFYNYNMLNYTFTYDIISNSHPSAPIFSYKNFSNPKNNNPFQQCCNSYNDFFKNSTETSGNIRFQTGLGLIYNRNDVHFSNLKSTIIKIKNEISVLQIYLPLGMTINNYINIELNQLIGSTAGPRAAMLLFSVPILLFVLVIGDFSINSNIQSRYDEFLLLKSKGISNKMIKNQLVAESFLIGVIAAILGALFGIAMFELNKGWLGKLFFLNQTIPSLPFYASIQSIIIIFLFGIGLTLFSSLSSIYKMDKIEIPDLLSTLGEENLKIEYDEHTLFGMSRPSFLLDDQIISNQTNSEIKNKKNNDDEEQKKVSKDFDINSIKENSKYHKDLIKKSQKKIPKISYIFLILSVFPLFLYFIGQFSLLPNSPVTLSNYLNILSGSNYLISILCIITPGLMVIGILLFITKESPSRFAKISRFVSKPFLKTKSYLIGLEMIKRKKFITIIFLIGIFSSLLVFTNFVFNSTSRYPIIENNLNIGADLKLQANVPSKIYNTSQTQILDENLLNITNGDGTYLINNVLTYYQQNEVSNQKVSYFNFTKYMQIIQEGGKFIPTDLGNVLSKAIAYDSNSSNIFPAAIVNEESMKIHNLNIGDVLQINHTQYNPISKNLTYTLFKVKIVGIYRFLPGIEMSSQNSNNLSLLNLSGFNLAIDSNIFNQTAQFLPLDSINQLVDLNLKASPNDTVIQNDIQSSTKNLIVYNDFSFYNQQWNSPHLMITPTTSGFYGLMYFEFIILGILLALGLAILMKSFQNDNTYFFGALMSKGFGKRGILMFMLSQIIIIFLIAILSGLLSGALTSIIFLKLSILINGELRGLNLILFYNGITIFEILVLIAVVCFSVYIMTYLIQMRKSISQYMRKF